jgi:hypothetical protein
VILKGVSPRSLPGKDPVALIGNRVIPKGVEIFLTVEQRIHHPGHAFGGNQIDQAISSDLPLVFRPKKLFYKVADHLVVAVDAIKASLEGVGEAEPTNEIADSDLTVSQLGFQIHVSIGLKGVEINLPVSAFNHCFQIVGIHGDVHGIRPWHLFGCDPQSRHP